MRTIEVILILVGILLIAFTVTMIITFWRMGTVPDTLITCFYGALAGECGVMGWIKTAKVRHQERNWIKEDQDEHKK